MSESEPDRAEKVEKPTRERMLRHRKVTDRAMVLPLLGVLALLPPFASIFEIDARIAGVPLTALYLFVVWALLIVGAARLARPLRAQDQSRPDVDTPDTHRDTP